MPSLLAQRLGQARVLGVERAARGGTWFPLILPSSGLVLPLASQPWNPSIGKQ